MLRKKLLIILGSLVALLVVVAVLAIWLLQGVLHNMDHTGREDALAADGITQMATTISEIEINLREIQLKRERHLDKLIELVENLGRETSRVDAEFAPSLPEGKPYFDDVVAVFPRFQRHIGMLANTQDPELAALHAADAMSASVVLRRDILTLSQLMQQHIVREQDTSMAWFRWLVLALAIVFLLVINISVMVLLRMAHMILRPVDQLVEASRRLAHEEFDYRVDVAQKDEFGELARAYNHLAEQLQANEDRKLETLVQTGVMLNHELNNVSTIIKLQLQLLGRQADGNPAFERTLRQINDSLNRMTSTVEALKHVRRIVLTDYNAGTKMLDLQRSVEEPAAGGAANRRRSDPGRSDVSTSGTGTSKSQVGMHHTEQNPESSMATRPQPWQSPLFLQQYWFIRLRWLAGVAVLAGGLINWRWLGVYPRDDGVIVAAGAGILAYNLALWELARRGRDALWTRWKLYALAWTQILLDLACLTALTAWTGGYRSPLLGFYVFHMVFASLLLPRFVAFAVAGVAIGMVEVALGVVDQWPRDRASQVEAVAWGLTLVATVYLAGHITESLRNQRRRLVRQNRRIRAMTKRLRRQQLAMVQQEKLAAMGQMAAGVAHEVANPLASLDGLLQLMERKPDKITPDGLARLREQVARINLIVRQMTAFAHPGEEQWQRGNVNDVVTRALEVIRFDRRLKRVTVRRELMETIPDITMLPAALEQVVVNLVVNALECDGGGGGSATEGADSTCEWDLHHRDRGYGDGYRAGESAAFVRAVFYDEAGGEGYGVGVVDQLQSGAETRR